MSIFRFDIGYIAILSVNSEKLLIRENKGKVFNIEHLVAHKY
jgi:hypothetical protein